MKKKLRIQVTSNPNAVHALGISEDRILFYWPANRRSLLQKRNVLSESTRGGYAG
jgi:hypothetical protein